MLAAAADFVCAADEVWRLQRGSEADCLWFQRAATGGERITSRGSHQGLWILSPAGDLLARCNTRNSERVLEQLAKGLAAWKELPAERKQLPPAEEFRPDHRWEDNFPEGGLVLERVARDVTIESGRWTRTDRWNRDYAWFRTEELRAVVPRELAVGSRFDLPLVADRLARYHLVDNARGQALPFASDDVECRLSAEVVGIEPRGVLLALEGETRAASEGTWKLGPGDWKPKVELAHGLETTLAGRALWLPDEGRFAEFELVALGRHWGRTTNNGRGRDASPGPIAFHLTLADAARRIAPTYVDVYDAPWITRPAVPTWVDSPEEFSTGEF